jgi:hypothetical protein
MTDNPPPPGFVRALTFEEMSPGQRELYTRRYWPLPQCECEYDHLQAFDDLIPGCHREKSE